MRGIALLIIVLVVLLALLVVRARTGGGAKLGGGLLPAIFGGAGARKKADTSRISSPRARARAEKGDVIVDTLNLTHHLIESGALKDDEAVARVLKKAKSKNGDAAPSHLISRCTITAAIRHSAPLLKEYFPGMIIYVIKDRESLPNTPRTRAFYATLAREQKVHIHVVERPDPDMYGASKRASWHVSGNTDPSHQQKGRDDFYIGLMAWKMQCGALTEDRMHDFDALKTEVAPFVVYEIKPWSDNPPVRNHVNPSAAEYKRVRAPTRLGFYYYDL